MGASCRPSSLATIMLAAADVPHGDPRDVWQCAHVEVMVSVVCRVAASVKQRLDQGQAQG